MSSISRKIKESKRRKRMQDDPPLLPVPYERTYIRDVREKLQQDPEYANCTRQELNRLAEDLTSPDKLKDSFFGSYEDYRSPLTSLSSLCPSMGIAPAPPKEETLSVRIIVTTPSSESRGKRRLPQGACGGAGTVLCILEEEYGKRIIKASIDVNGQKLTWGPYHLVIPQGRAIPQGASPYPSLSSLEAGPRIHEEPEHGDEYRLEPCPSDKLDSFLKVVSNYNKTYMFDHLHRNSVHFVCDALKALGYQNPPEPLRNRYNNYFRELKQKKTARIPADFQDHAAIGHYIRQGTNFAQIKKNPFDVEFLLNYYVRFHWDRKSQAKEPGKWECPENQCWMEDLESEITPEQLFINEFR